MTVESFSNTAHHIYRYAILRIAISCRCYSRKCDYTVGHTKLRHSSIVNLRDKYYGILMRGIQIAIFRTPARIYRNNVSRLILSAVPEFGVDEGTYDKTA